MREILQKPSKVAFLSIVVLAVVLLILGIGVLKAIQSKPAVAHAQGSDQVVMPSETQSTTTIVQSSPTTTNSGASKQQVSNPVTQQPTSTNQPASNNTTDEWLSINPQNTWHPEVGVITGHVTYDASGNACGIGPTGICTMPFPGRTVDVWDTAGNIVASMVSDSTGAFACKLKPGTYTVVPGPGYGVNPTAKSQQVTIAKGGSVEVLIDYWAIAMTNALQL